MQFITIHGFRHPLVVLEVFPSEKAGCGGDYCNHSLKAVTSSHPKTLSRIVLHIKDIPVDPKSREFSLKRKPREKGRYHQIGIQNM